MLSSSNSTVRRSSGVCDDRYKRCAKVQKMPLTERLLGAGHKASVYVLACVYAVMNIFEGMVRTCVHIYKRVGGCVCFSVLLMHLCACAHVWWFLHGTACQRSWEGLRS
jgi:hypothetical protein